jgi:hypothetical protein
MTARYYRDLHDRELLNQAEALFAELKRRNLLEVRVPCYVSAEEDDLVSCSVYSAERQGGALSLLINRRFQRMTPFWSEEAAANGKAR